MFHTYVASVCSKYFICFKLMLHSSVSCYSVSCFRGMFRESWGTMWVMGEGESPMFAVGN
jgi:hypothetical protein